MFLEYFFLFFTIFKRVFFCFGFFLLFGGRLLNKLVNKVAQGTTLLESCSALFSTVSRFVRVFGSMGGG